MPWQQRAANLGVCLNGMAECTVTRYTNFSENLWRVAVSALNAVISIGLPAVNIAYVNHDIPPDPQVWTALSSALSRYALSALSLPHPSCIDHGTHEKACQLKDKSVFKVVMLATGNSSYMTDALVTTGLGMSFQSLQFMLTSCTSKLKQLALWKQ